MDFDNGTYKILYIKVSGTYYPVGLLTGNSFNESVAMMDATTKDIADGWQSPTPINQNYNISFSGLITIDSEDGDILTFRDIQDLKRERTKIEWKIESDSEDSTDYDIGSGYISSLSDNSNIDEFISFSGEIVGWGEPEVSSKDTTGLLLDSYTGAAAAYSLRKLKASATYSVEIRRDSDNTTTNVLLDTSGSLTLSSTVSAGGTLGTWVGSNSAYVKTWYDQSGNGVDVIQTTTGIQPRLINTGALITVNGNPVVDFSRVTSDYLQSSVQTSVSQPTTKFDVVYFKNVTLSHYVHDGASIRQACGVATGQMKLYAGSSLLGSAGSHVIDTQYIRTSLYNSTTSAMYANGSSVGSGNVGVGAWDGVTIGSAPNASSNYSGYTQELIVYTSNKSGDRSSIESNINTHYSVY